MIDYTSYFVQKPADVSRIRTVELYNPDFGTLRLVNGFTDRQLALESGAPRNSGETVDFQAIDLSWPDPSMDESATISVNVTFSRVGTRARELVKTITPEGGLRGIEVVLREYFSDNLTAPQAVFYLYSPAITISGPSVSLQASDTNPALQNTADVYTLNRFPGLRDL